MIITADQHYLEDLDNERIQDAVRTALAAAWEQGLAAGLDWASEVIKGAVPNPTPNPYLKSTNPLKE